MNECKEKHFWEEKPGRMEPLLTQKLFICLSSQINIRNAEKVSTINKAFAEIQKEVQQLSKGTAAEPQKSDQVSTHMAEEPANVDTATSLLSQL
ncbi:ribosomal biogenesis factor isoform 2-T2 [Morus bassanus]